MRTPGRLWRWVTAAIAWVAAVAGWTALVYDLYGPTYITEHCGLVGVCVASTKSLVEVGLTAEAARFLAFVAGLFLGVAAGGVLVATGRRWLGVGMISGCFALLLGAIWISGFSVGPSFLPADALAGAAVAIGVVSAGLSRLHGSRTAEGQPSNLPSNGV